MKTQEKIGYLHILNAIASNLNNTDKAREAANEAIIQLLKTF